MKILNTAITTINGHFLKDKSGSDLRLYGPFEPRAFKTAKLVVERDSRDQVFFKTAEGKYYILEGSSLDAVKRLWTIAKPQETVVITSNHQDLVGTVVGVNDELFDGRHGVSNLLLALERTQAESLQEEIDTLEQDGGDKAKAKVRSLQEQIMELRAPANGGFSLR